MPHSTRSLINRYLSGTGDVCGRMCECGYVSSIQCINTNRHLSFLDNFVISIIKFIYHGQHDVWLLHNLKRNTKFTSWMAVVVHFQLGFLEICISFIQRRMASSIFRRLKPCIKILRSGTSSIIVLLELIVSRKSSRFLLQLYHEMMNLFSFVNCFVVICS